MRTKLILLIILAVLLYAIGNYYVAVRFYTACKAAVTPSVLSIAIAVYIFVACSYIGGRIANIYLPGVLSDALIKVGSYWLALSFYFVVLWGALDIVGFLAALLALPRDFAHSYIAAFIIMGLSCGVVIYGTINANNPNIRRYDITVSKMAPALKTLHIVVVTDIHLGLIVNSTRLKCLINKISRLEPDLVLFPGDILDETIGAFADSHMAQTFRTLRSPYGIFGALGSHEYIWGHADKTITYLTQAGITILRDSSVKLANSIYIVGRDDYYRDQLVGTPRAGLDTLLKNCDLSLPIILLDHQPRHLEESVEAGIDIQLSGHTHHGQFFPLSLVTSYMFELDWGYKKKMNTHFIVSSGFGTWGPPIRVGTVSEIIDLHVTFESP